MTTIVARVTARGRKWNYVHVLSGPDEDHLRLLGRLRVASGEETSELLARLNQLSLFPPPEAPGAEVP